MDTGQPSGLTSAKEYRQWLSTRAKKWSSDEATKQAWADAVQARFGAALNYQGVSGDEIEELLGLVGDFEAAATRIGTEPLYDGEVKKIMPEGHRGFLTSPLFEIDVYLHASHLRGLQVGDPVRFAVHYNAKGQPQVSWAERMQKGSNPREDLAPAPAVAAAPAVTPWQQAAPWQAAPAAPAAGLLVQLPDGSLMEAWPVVHHGLLQSQMPVPAVPHVVPDVQPWAMAPTVHAQPWAPQHSPAKGKGKGKGKGPAPQLDQSGGDEDRVHVGQVKIKGDKGGFISCEELKAVYGRDVYMWNTYFDQCEVGDWVQFKVHISKARNMPQVSWLQNCSGPGSGTASHNAQLQTAAVQPTQFLAAGSKRPAPGSAPELLPIMKAMRT